MFARLLTSALLLAAGLTAASAHATLDHASPAAGSTVQEAPTHLTLAFTEPLEPAFSGATVTNASGQRVDTGARAGSNKRELQISLKPLPPGSYKVNWHVLSVDTHKAKGSYSFTVSGP
jgi:copper resistance protein C